MIAEIFDPVQGSFAAAGALTTDRLSHTAVLMGDGRVFLIGGLSGANCLDSTEMFDPATGLSTVSAPMRLPRASHTATVLTNGQVLVAGGQNCDFDPSTAATTIERFDPTSGTFAGRAIWPLVIRPAFAWVTPLLCCQMGKYCSMEANP